MRTIHELLEDLNACAEATKWAKQYSTIEEIVANCHRGDWLLWLASKMKMDLRLLTLGKARCAKTVLHLMTDERSVNAVNIAEKYGLGQCDDDELRRAAAYAAADAAAAADYADYAAAEHQNQMQTSNICRETFGKQLIQLVNDKLN